MVVKHQNPTTINLAKTTMAIWRATLSQQLDVAWSRVEKFYYQPIEAPENVVKMRVN